MLGIRSFHFGIHPIFRGKLAASFRDDDWAICPLGPGKGLGFDCRIFLENICVCGTYFVRLKSKS